MSKPDLSDPAQRSAYRRELRRAYRPWRWGGLALVTAGLVVMLVRGNGFDTPSLILLGIGWMILAGVIVARTRYHRRRMREL
jgi:drug/metabolite transporter (DMT)-like permease